MEGGSRERFGKGGGPTGVDRHEMRDTAAQILKGGEGTGVVISAGNLRSLTTFRPKEKKGGEGSRRCAETEGERERQRGGAAPKQPAGGERERIK